MVTPPPHRQIFVWWVEGILDENIDPLNSISAFESTQCAINKRLAAPNLSDTTAGLQTDEGKDCTGTPDLSTLISWDRY